jgi:omega-hydroxypalmitate O-feruloyl transferase
MQSTKMLFTVDIRARTQPPLPDAYFGNADAATICEASAKELESQPLSWVSSLVQRWLYILVHAIQT